MFEVLACMETEVKIRRSRSKKNNIALIIIFASIALMILSASVFAYMTLRYDRVYKGVYAGSLDVSGLSWQELRDELKSVYFVPGDGTGITLKASNIEMSLPFSEISLEYDIDAAVKEAYSIGRKGNIFVRLYEIFSAGAKGIHIPINQTYDEGKVNAFVNQFSDRLFKSVKESSLLISDKEVILRSGRHGEHIDKSETLEQITNLIKSGKGGIVTPEVITTNPTPINADEIYKQIISEPADAYYKKVGKELVLVPHSVGRDIDKRKLEEIVKELDGTEEKDYMLPVSIVMPSVTSDAARSMLFRDELGSATTSFGTGTVNGQNRKFNMQLAIKNIDQLILMPGEEFSFNEVVGPRNAELGYKPAHVYMQGRIVDGIGGGICQVSTTLYNAVLMADLEVTERRNHSFTVAYVPLGQDATAFYGGTDFRFVNSTKWPIKLLSNITGNKIHFSIIGTNETPGKTVIISNKILSRTPFTVQTQEDPTLPVGTTKELQEGLDGYVVETFKTVKIDGKLISEKKLHTSRYNPCTQILLVGTKPVDGVTPPAESGQSEKDPAGGPEIIDEGDPNQNAGISDAADSEQSITNGSNNTLTDSGHTSTEASNGTPAGNKQTDGQTGGVSSGSNQADTEISGDAPSGNE